MQKYTGILTAIAVPAQAIGLLGAAIYAGNVWNAAWVAALIGVVIIIQPLTAQVARFAYCLEH